MDFQDSISGSEIAGQAADMYALNNICVSDKQFDLMIAHNFGKAFMRIAIYLIGNYNVNTGAIHRKRCAEIAKQAGVSLGDVYAFKKYAKKIGFADFSISNMKLTGKLKHYPKVRWSEADDAVVEVNKMRVAMIHREGVYLLMNNDVAGSQIRLSIATAFYCDAKTGTLHEKHPETWARLIGRFRTTVTRGLKRLNEIGFLQTRTDYLVEGKLPWTAYACAWFQQHRIAKIRMERGTPEMKVKLDFMKAVRWLREGYGFCVEFLNNPSKVMEAAKALRPWANDVDKSKPRASQSAGYHLTKCGTKHWTNKDAFLKAFDGLKEEPGVTL